MTWYADVFGAGKVLTATTTVELGDTGYRGVSRWLVTFVDEGSENFSIVPKGTAKGSGQTKGNVGYTTVADPNTNIDPGSTPITTMGSYLIEASGMDIDLVCTRTAGSMRVIARAQQG